MLIVFIAFIIFLIVGMPIAFAVGISGALFFVQHSNLPATIMVQMPLIPEGANWLGNTNIS